MRIWTTIFLVVATLIAAVATTTDGAAMGTLLARMLFSFLGLAALLYGVRLLTLQMGAHCNGSARELTPRQQPERARSHSAERRAPEEHPLGPVRQTRPDASISRT